jgi:hypothetical protein
MTEGTAASVVQLPGYDCHDRFSRTTGAKSLKRICDRARRLEPHNCPQPNKDFGVTATLIEACASNRRGLAISNEEQSDV